MTSLGNPTSSTESVLSCGDQRNKELGLGSKEVKVLLQKVFQINFMFSFKVLDVIKERKIKDCGKDWVRWIITELTNLHLQFILKVVPKWLEEIPREG